MLWKWPTGSHRCGKHTKSLGKLGLVMFLMQGTFSLCKFYHITTFLHNTARHDPPDMLRMRPLTHPVLGWYSLRPLLRPTSGMSISSPEAKEPPPSRGSLAEPAAVLNAHDSRTAFPDDSINPSPGASGANSWPARIGRRLSLVRPPCSTRGAERPSRQTGLAIHVDGGSAIRVLRFPTRVAFYEVWCIQAGGHR